MGELTLDFTDHDKADVSFRVSSRPAVVVDLIGPGAAIAIREGRMAQLAAQSALASSNYFGSQAAGEAGTLAGELFTHPDGSGGLVYRQRTSGGSTIIANALTQAQLTAAQAALSALIDVQADRIDDVNGALLGRRSVREYGAFGTGLIDVHDQVQDAVDDMAGGGELFFPPGLYTMTGGVNITHKKIRIRLAPGAVIKVLGYAGFDRGAFQLEGVLESEFELVGGEIDLNGEGPRGIGSAGRIGNTYNIGTVAAVKVINGPVNAAVFARRSTHITVTDTIIRNSGEDGLLFRNCGHVTVRRTKFYNIANWGVEMSFTPPDGDGGATTMPTDRGNWLFEDLYFEDMDDLGLGMKNGGCIGGGSSSDVSTGIHYGVTIRRVDMYRVWRGFQLEAPHGGTLWENVAIEDITYREVSQTIVAMIGVGSLKIRRLSGDNLGDAAANAIAYVARGGTTTAHYNDVAGIIISGDCRYAEISGCDMRDARAGGLVKRADGSIAAGDNVLTSPGAAFAPTDVGKSVSIIGAGWSGMFEGAPFALAHSSFITEYVDAHTVKIEHDAITTVSGSTFAYGGQTRSAVLIKGDRPRALDGVTVNGTGGYTYVLHDNQFVAGNSASLTNEPAGVPISAVAVRGLLSIKNTQISAPLGGTIGATAVVTADSTDGFPGRIEIDESLKVSGFGTKYAGKFARRPSGLPQTKSFPLDRFLAPNAAADTYGDTEVCYTDSATFIDLLRASFEAVTTPGSGAFSTAGPFAVGETVTFRLGLAEHDGDAAFTPIEITMTAAGIKLVDAGKLLALNPDARDFKAMQIAMKSSVAGSNVKGKGNATARQV